MTLTGIMLNNPRALGWLVILSSFMLGAMLTGGMMTLFRRRLFARSIAKHQQADNDRLTALLKQERAEHAKTRADKANAIGMLAAARIKVMAGVGQIMSGFDGVSLLSEGRIDDETN